MKIKLKDSARHHASADDAVEALRKHFDLYPDWTPVGVTVARLRNPLTWQATAILEKEVDW